MKKNRMTHRKLRSVAMILFLGAFVAVATACEPGPYGEESQVEGVPYRLKYCAQLAYRLPEEWTEDMTEEEVRTFEASQVKEIAAGAWVQFTFGIYDFRNKAWLTAELPGAEDEVAPLTEEGEYCTEVSGVNSEEFSVDGAIPDVHDSETLSTLAGVYNLNMAFLRRESTTGEDAYWFDGHFYFGDQKLALLWPLNMYPARIEVTQEPSEEGSIERIYSVRVTYDHFHVDYSVLQSRPPSVEFVMNGRSKTYHLK